MEVARHCIQLTSGLQQGSCAKPKWQTLWLLKEEYIFIQDKNDKLVIAYLLFYHFVYANS